MTRIRIHAAIAATLASLVLVGCGEKPPVCDSLDALQHSASALRNTNLSENGVSALKNNVTQVRADLAELAADARVQYQSQLAGVQSAVDHLSAAASSAKADPNATTIQAVGAALGLVAESMTSLQNAMSGTC